MEATVCPRGNFTETHGAFQQAADFLRLGGPFLGWGIRSYPRAVFVRLLSLLENAMGHQHLGTLRNPAIYVPVAAFSGTASEEFSLTSAISSNGKVSPQEMHCTADLLATTKSPPHFGHGVGKGRFHEVKSHSG